jgi:hypothetical protein
MLNVGGYGMSSKVRGQSRGSSCQRKRGSGLQPVSGPPGLTPCFWSVDPEDVIEALDDNNMIVTATLNALRRARKEKSIQRAICELHGRLWI